MDIRDWLTPGPNALNMDINDVAKFFNVHTTTIREWIKKGTFPVGQRQGGEEVWTGQDIGCYIHLRGRFRSDIDAETARKKAD